MLRSTLALSLALGLALCPSAQGRYALAIGNGEYASLPRLKNPANDASDVAAALTGLGFDVDLLTDATRREMNQAIVAFRERLASDAQSEGVFFFAGHGVQSSKNVNYLMPVDAAVASEADLEDEGVRAQKVLDSLDEARNRVNLVILDACRDNPLPAKARSSGARGLAVVSSAPPETIVLYSTAAGQTAADGGSGRNSPFTASLLKYISEPEDITKVVKLVTGEVKARTPGAQTPFQYSNLSRDFYLNREALAKSAPSASAPPPAAPRLAVSRAYGSLTIVAASAGALYLGGVAMGELPAGAEARLDDVEAGERILELRYPGGEKETKSATVKKGQTSSVGFAWKKAVPQAASPAPISAQAPATLGDLVFVVGGSFMIGSNEGEPDEKPLHEVRVSDFYIGKYEVTQAQYRSVAGSNPSYFKGDKLPVEKVSWYEAVAFCNALSEREGLRKAYAISGTKVSVDFSADGYRLPTEAEWEYGARGGTAGTMRTVKYAGSDSVDAVAWYSSNSDNKTHDVGTKAPNELGLYDMSGNVWEWCWDWFSAYSAGLQADPMGASSGGGRVNRGGSWENDASSIRSANRFYLGPEIRDSHLGFRLARRP